MSRRQRDPLRVLSVAERNELARLSRSRRAPAAQVARATALLAIADGQSYLAAAQRVGRRDGDTVAAWVARSNREGLAAVVPRHGGGPPIRCGAAQQQQRILAAARRIPDRARDGTATWSLRTLQAALRHAEDGLPTVSTYTIWHTLHAADLSWQRDRTWCATGVVVRKRQRGGTVVVTDLDAVAKKKVDRAGLYARPAVGPGGLVRGRGGAVSGHPSPWQQLAPAGPARDAAARVRARGHDQDPDPVPSCDRPGADPAGNQWHEPGPAQLAPGDADSDRGGAAGGHAARAAGQPRAVAEGAERSGGPLHPAPADLPPLRVLPVWDNLAGHKTPEMVPWLCRHGIMPLYTPLGGSWLNMAEAIQRLLKRRALDGQQPRRPAESGPWFEPTARHWNQHPPPFVWDGRRRQRRRRRPGDGHPSAVARLTPTKRRLAYGKPSQNTDIHAK